MNIEYLTGLKFVTVIPTIDSETLHRVEVPRMCGEDLPGFRATGFHIKFDYQRIGMVISFHRIRKSHDHGSVIEVEAAYKTRSQPWDMGGSYLDPEDLDDDIV